MKSIKLLSILLLLISLKTFSQMATRGEKREQIKTLKIGFITDELQLTSDEASRFWPIFNAFEEKQGAIRRKKMKSYIDRMDEESLDKITDKDANALLVQMEINEDDLYQLRKKFVISLKDVISPVKIIKLKRAEERFNKKLLQQYKEKNRD